MVKSESKHSEKTNAKHGFPEDRSDPIKLRLPRILTSGRKTLLLPAALVSRGKDVGEAGLQSTD